MAAPTHSILSMVLFILAAHCVTAQTLTGVASALTSNLVELAAKTTDQIALDVLLSTLVYPKTESLNDDIPRVLWKMVIPGEVPGPNDVLNFDDAITKAVHPELQALNAVADVQQALRMVIKLENAQPQAVRMYDALQLYRGGVDLVRIEFAPQMHSPVNRAVFMEINDYRRRLVALAMEPHTSPYAKDLVHSTASAAILSFSVFIGIIGAYIGTYVFKFGVEWFVKYVARVSKPTDAVSRTATS